MWTVYAVFRSKFQYKLWFISACSWDAPLDRSFIFNLRKLVWLLNSRCSYWSIIGVSGRTYAAGWGRGGGADAPIETPLPRGLWNCPTSSVIPPVLFLNHHRHRYHIAPVNPSHPRVPISFSFRILLNLFWIWSPCFVAMNLTNILTSFLSTIRLWWSFTDQ